MFSQDTRSCKRNPERYENSFYDPLLIIEKQMDIWKGSPVDFDSKEGKVILGG